MTRRNGDLVRIVLLGAALLLTACGHKPELRSPREQQAIDFNRQGETAFRYGEYRLAIDHFQASLRMNETIENIDGIAINRINLAKSYQALGDLAGSQREADSLLQERVLQFAPAHLAAAAIQKSLLLLQQGQADAAQEWIDRARDYCADRCDARGVMLNVRTGIALARGDAATAAQWGEQALKENNTPVEHANALRLLAEARLMAGASGAALPLLQEALTQDKQLGATTKIAMDMELLARACAASGDPDKAREFGERARRVRQPDSGK